MRNARTVPRGAGLSAWLALALLGCASPVKVETEAHPGTDFSRYETYAVTPPATGDPALRERVERAIAHELDARGLSEAPRETAELLVGFQVRAREVEQMKDIGFPGDATLVVDREVEGDLSIDMRDARSGRRVWQGVGILDAGSARGVEQAAGEAVKAVLVDFPPEPASGPGGEH